MKKQKLFNYIEALALAKIINKETKEIARAGVKPGKHSFDVAFRIKGSLTVGEDYERAPTVAIPLLEVLALFIARAGITREASESLLVDCITSALEKNDGKAQGELALALPQVESTLERVQSEIIAKLPKASVKGPTRAVLEIVRLNAQDNVETMMLAIDALQSAESAGAIAH